MLHRSIIETRGSVLFPEYTGERVYMEPFYANDGLPDHLSRWQDTVDAMLDGITTDQRVFIMIDQSPVKAGVPQRRPGIHIDGYWVDTVTSHRGDPHHYPIPARNPGHRATPGHRGQLPSHACLVDDWSAATFDVPEGIILASTVSAARGFIGTYEGRIGHMGDCSAIDVSGMDVVDMQAGMVYAGNVNCLHESLPVQEDCVRTLVRLNVPGWTPQK